MMVLCHQLMQSYAKNESQIQFESTMNYTLLQKAIVGNVPDRFSLQNLFIHDCSR